MFKWLLIGWVLVTLTLYQVQRDTSLCDAHPTLYHDFGPECLNPVQYNLPGMYPIGTPVQNRGVITGYYWNVVEQRYWYTSAAGSQGWMFPPEGLS